MKNLWAFSLLACSLNACSPECLCPCYCANQVGSGTGEEPVVIQGQDNVSEPTGALETGPTGTPEVASETQSAIPEPTVPTDTTEIHDPLQEHSPVATETELIADQPAPTLPLTPVPVIDLNGSINTCQIYPIGCNMKITESKDKLNTGLQDDCYMLFDPNATTVSIQANFIGAVIGDGIFSIFNYFERVIAKHTQSVILAIAKDIPSDQKFMVVVYVEGGKIDKVEMVEALNIEWYHQRKDGGMTMKTDLSRIRTTLDRNAAKRYYSDFQKQHVLTLEDVEARSVLLLPKQDKVVPAGVDKHNCEKLSTYLTEVNELFLWKGGLVERCGIVRFIAQNRLIFTCCKVLELKDFLKIVSNYGVHEHTGSPFESIKIDIRSLGTDLLTYRRLEREHFNRTQRSRGDILVVRDKYQNEYFPIVWLGEELMIYIDKDGRNRVEKLKLF